MDPFNRGRVIGYILADFILPFFYMWFGVWIYEKIRKRKIQRWRLLKIILGGVVIFVMSVLLRDFSRYVV